MGAFGLSTENAADDALSGGFVELSDMKKNNSRRKLEPVVVTTVHSEESGEMKNKTEEAKELTFDIFPKSTRASIQMGMTLLFVLLLPAAFLTITSNPEYAFVIGVFWFILVSLFLGLIWVVRAVMLKDSRAQVFHPIVHAVAERIIQEINDFRDDIRQEILLITDGPVDYEDCSEVSQDQSSCPAKNTKKKTISEQSRKPKSVIFRAVVQPFLPLARRRKRRQKQATNEDETSYEPPRSFV